MITGKSILIIGGTGSIGYTLTSRYIKNNKIIIYSRSENNQWKMKQDYPSPNISFFIGDIRDTIRLEQCLFQYKPNIIIIASAMKHIDIAEKNVHECISTNVDGIRNISTIFCRNTIPSVETIVFISTDKACAPINTYGMTKALGEKIIAELSEHVTKPKMVNVRYGNVINSRGSLIPLYNSIGQDPEKTHFPITNKDMTRFFMSLNESAELIEYAILHGEPGDTIIPREISAYKISDIASYFSGKYNKPVVVSSVRTGEKLHEALISYTETYRTIARDKYYIILPTYKPIVEERILQDELTSLRNLRPVSDIVNKF